MPNHLWRRFHCRVVHLLVSCILGPNTLLYSVLTRLYFYINAVIKDDRRLLSWLLIIGPGLSLQCLPILSIFNFYFRKVILSSLESNSIISSRMRSVGLATAVLATLVAGAANAATVSVSGEAEGFAAGVTGGGDATPVYPADIEELKTYLTSDEPQVVVLDRTFNFLNSEGTKTETGCAPYTTEAGCQQAIDATGTWCSSDVSSVEVTYDVAATEGIELGSNKTIIGVEDKGVIIGKGFRMTNGASNISKYHLHCGTMGPSQYCQVLMSQFGPNPCSCAFNC